MDNYYIIYEVYENTAYEYETCGLFTTRELAEKAIESYKKADIENDNDFFEYCITETKLYYK